jgi:maltooligosyltrehalose trehalohydrolase
MIVDKTMARREADDAECGENSRRKYPIGAEVLASGGTHFRVWAPRHSRVDVVLESGPGAPGTFPLRAEAEGYFGGVADGARAGTRYRFRLGDDEQTLPDPASRYQPDGPDGPSEVVDPSSFTWTDAAWRGIVSPQGQVIYELHIGTFTPEGTWAAAEDELEYLAGLGVSVLEIMPLSEFPGRFNWGYDGVDLFAPFHEYGTPDDVRRFVDRAHALGLGVILDVVYNHLGPEWNVLPHYSDDYFSRRHKSEWGDTLNFDGPNCRAVREFVLTNVDYWIDEFHLDGMRVDATQGLYDTGPVHILREIAHRIHEAGGGRRTLVVGESEPQRAVLLRGPRAGGMGFDMLWNEDFHHAAMVAATGVREGYYGDYQGTPQELVSTTKRGWLYQGQWNLRQGKRRGSLAWDIPPHSFISYLQNHDQVANSPGGERIHRQTSPGRYRAITALQLLGPATPLLFQGQEYAASSPFLYFSDLRSEIAEELLQGRRDFLKQFASQATPEMQALVPPPHDLRGFRRSKLDPAERERVEHAKILAMHRELLRLRREDPTIRAGQRPGAIDGAVIGPEALVLRWFAPEGTGDERLLLVNLGVELSLRATAEPLLSPPGDGRRWRLLWSSEDPRYGGRGTPAPESEEGNWNLPSHAALLMGPEDALGDEYRNLPGTA